MLLCDCIGFCIISFATYKDIEGTCTRIGIYPFCKVGDGFYVDHWCRAGKSCVVNKTDNHCFIGKCTRVEHDGICVCRKFHVTALSRIVYDTYSDAIKSCPSED